jgi:hypothetical protein
MTDLTCEHVLMSLTLELKCAGMGHCTKSLRAHLLVVGSLVGGWVHPSAQQDP